MNANKSPKATTGLVLSSGRNGTVESPQDISDDEDITQITTGGEYEEHAEDGVNDSDSEGANGENEDEDEDENEEEESEVRI